MKEDLAIPEGDRANFNTLCKAYDNGDLCLVSTTRKSDGKRVSLVTAMGYDADSKEFLPCPVAVMIEGNPYELFDDPTEEPDNDVPCDDCAND